MATTESGLPGSLPLPENGSEPPADSLPPKKPQNDFMGGLGMFLKATQSMVDTVVVAPTRAVVDGTAKLAAPMAEGLGDAMKGALDDVSGKKKKEEAAAAVKVQAALRGKRARASYSETKAAARSKFWRGIPGALVASSRRIGLLLLALAVIAAGAAMVYAPQSPFESVQDVPRGGMKRQRKDPT